MGSAKNRRWAGALVALAAAFFVVGGMGILLLGPDRSPVDGSRDGGPPRIELEEDGAAIVVLGLESPLIDALNDALSGSAPSSEGWQSLFPVRVASDASSDLPVMLGEYAVEGDRVVFRPRFALVPGTSYTARFDPSSLAGASSLGGAAGLEEAADFGALAAELSVPLDTSAPPTRVVQVYPSGPIVPMNLLKMYVHFSAPMSFGEAYHHVRLRNASGDVVPDAILEVLEELWDPERRRLTLLFDPGRIKRGLEPNLTLGLPLRDGESYVLEIDEGWRDGSGRPLAEGFTKEFSVGAVDRVSPDTDAWVVKPPAAGSRDPLEIVFPEPMDRALLDRLITVSTDRGDRRGERVEGRIAVTDHETVWRLTLDRPWNAGSYVIDVDALLEDLAGNNLASLFDVDLTQDVRLSEDEARARLPFEVR